MIHRAGAESALAREALSELLVTYRPAMCAHVARRRRVDVNRAEDLVQGFITDRVLEKNLIAHADRDKGRFRTFLLTALDRYVASQFQYEQRQKRAPKDAPVVALSGAEADGGAAGTDAFDVAWATASLAEAARRMQAECDESQRADLWGVFEARLYAPLTRGVEPADYGDVIARYRFGSPMKASNALMTAKRMFTRHLRAVVAEYAGDEDQVDIEIAELRDVLASTGMGVVDGQR